MLSPSLNHVEQCIIRQNIHRSLNAFVALADAAALQAAATQLDSSIKGSLPLQGRLISLKDNIATDSAPTTCGSRALTSYKPAQESTVARLLKESGALICGKTTMDEFGMGSHSQSAHQGPVRSHFGTNLSPGGSSGGAAISVATGQAHAAIGTDTGGSVRLPAAWTGTVGFKPSYGRISRWGVIDYANSLDTVGVLGRSVEDTQAVARVLDKADGRDPTCLARQSRSRIVEAARKWQASRQERRGGRLRIGVPLEYNVKGLQTEVKHAWRDVLVKLESAGHEVVPVSLPSTKLALGAYYILAPAEASSNLAKYDGIRYGYRSEGPDEVRDRASDGSATNLPGDQLSSVLYAKTRGEAFGPEVQRRILLGTYTLSSSAMDNYFLQAQRVRRLIQREYNAVFGMAHPLLNPISGGFEVGEAGVHDVDVLVAPTAPTLPPTLEQVAAQTAVERYVGDVLTVPASLAALPALSVPVFLDGGRRSVTDAGEASHGLPVDTVGIQVIGQYGDDESVLDAGIMIEGLYI